MAKSTKTVSFSKATLEVDNENDVITITEYTKDETKVYDFLKILKEWNGIENISLSIKMDDEIESIE